MAAVGEEPARVHPVAYAEAELPDLAAYIRFIISKTKAGLPISSRRVWDQSAGIKS
jgi:hypothetical protein